MKKITLYTTVQLTLHADEDVSIDKVMEEMDYSFVDQTDQADIVDTEIREWKVADAR